ncbi:MAG: cation diffusion facilitator family transporter [Bacteroidales bacterium]
MGHSHTHHEHKTKWVVILTAVTMVAEIFFGITSRSMALLADGIHMGSHVLAIGMSWLAYVFVRKISNGAHFSGDSRKILSLSGYSSGLLLLIFAVFILIEAVGRIFSPSVIHYQEAILVACIGLAVNIGSAFLLHHDHEESDHNIKAAYIHVLADALTSVAAIVGLTAAMIWGLVWIDALCAIVSSFVIVKWSIGLLSQSGKALLDVKP